MGDIVWEVTVTQILILQFTFRVDYCAPFHQRIWIFLIPIYKILVLSCQIQLFRSFHIVQATFLSFLTTQEKHGRRYYFNKESCIDPKDSLVVICLNLKLLPSVVLKVTGPVTSCHKHKQYIQPPMDRNSA